MKTKSSCFTGHRENKLPYNIKSKEYELVENQIKDEILRLINIGVTDFYVGGQTGVDTTSAQLVIYLRDVCGYPIKLHLVIPYKDMYMFSTPLQQDDFVFIQKRVDSEVVLNEKYVKDCFRQRNQYMIDRSDYLVAVWDGNRNSGTWMTINMGNKKGLHITIINIPLTQKKEEQPSK